jgi:hypothetical protein
MILLTFRPRLLAALAIAASFVFGFALLWGQAINPTPGGSNFTQGVAYVDQNGKINGLGTANPKNCVHKDGTDGTCAGSGGGAATIPSTTNLINGDGAGNGADSGIAPSAVELGAHKDAINGYAGLDGSALLKMAECPTATSGQKGCLAATDWSTFNGKQASLGFTPENSANKDAVSGYAGLDGSGNLKVATECPTASGSQKGCLSSSDWSTFNGKQNALGFTPENSANKDAVSGYAGLDGSGLLKEAEMPNPSASTLGGVQSVSATSHQWVDSINTSGVPHKSQPAAADVSGLAASATTDTTNATNITSGTLGSPRMPYTPMGMAGIKATQTSTYTIVSGDAGLIVPYNGSSITANLPASAPASPWCVGIVNINQTALTVSPNGLNFDGQSSSFNLGQYGMAQVCSDGSNYWISASNGAHVFGPTSASVNPATSTAYLLTTVFGGGGIQTADDLRSRLYFDQAHLIVGATLIAGVRGTLSSNNTFSVTIAKNSGGTSCTISSSVNLNAAGPTKYAASSCVFAVAAGDYIQVKFTTPAWSTVPTTVDMETVLTAF